MTTAAQLAQRRRITQAAAKRRPRKLPPAKQPTGATLALTAPLLAIARDIDAAVNEALVAEGLDVLRTDAADGDLPPINRRGLLARLQRLAARIVQRRGSFLDDALVKVGDAVSAFSKSQWQAQAEAAMGVDLSAIEPNLAPAIKAFRQSHVDLIKTMTEGKVERVRAILEDAGPGSRVETIRNRLMEDEGVSKRQASLIARDQVLKLNSAVTRKRHEAAGVTHYLWRTSGDASVRPEHRALEGKKFAYDSPPVVSKKGDRARPGEFYQCLPGDAPLRLAPGVVRAYRRWYSGELTTLVTDSGEALHATPNHPVLTRRGWIPAHLVDVGDDVFSTQVEPLRIPERDPEHRQPTMQEVFDALATLLGSEGACGHAMGFHGDASVDEDVDVVRTEGGLPDHVTALRAEQVRQQLLAMAHTNPQLPCPGVRNVLAMLHALGYPANRVVRGLGEALALRGFRVRHADEHRVAPTAGGDARPGETATDPGPRDSEATRQCKHTLAALEPLHDLSNVDLLRAVRWAVRGDVDEPPIAERLAEVVRVAPEGAGDLGHGGAVVQRTLRVVQKLRREYTGHVYNLETVAGWFDSTLITHNCRCTMEPFLEGFDEDPGDAPSQPKHNREAFAQGPLSRPAARRRKPAAVPARASHADAPDEGPVTVRAAQWGKGGPPRGR